MALGWEVWQRRKPAPKSSFEEETRVLDRLTTQLQRRRRLLFALALGLIYLLHLAYPLNAYLADSLLDGVGLTAYAVLGCFYIWYRGARGGWALRWLLLYALWLALSRVLSGDRTLLREGWQVWSALLWLSLCGLGGVLDREERRRLLGFLAPVTAVLYTGLGLAGLYVFIMRTTLHYPVTQAVIGIEYGFRLGILGASPNFSAVWFLLAIAMLVYLICRARAPLWRLLLAPALAVNYLALTATYSRSVYLAFSLEAALFAALLLGRLLRCKRRAVKAGLLALAMAAVLVLSYKSFDGAAALLGDLSRRLRAGTGAVAFAEEIDDAGPAEEIAVVEDVFRDARGLSGSERVEIWLTLPEVFRREPARLLRGCLYGERMDMTNELLQAQGILQVKGSFHNSVLEVFNYTGVPGLLCLLGFLGALLLACARLLLGGGELAVKTLALPVIGLVAYSQLESLLLMKTDIRSVAFFLFAGLVLAEAREA